MSLSVTASQLRETVCDHLINDIEDYIEFFVCANDETKHAYYLLYQGGRKHEIARCLEQSAS